MPSNHDMVKSFQSAFDQPVADKPTMMERGSEQDSLHLRIMANRLEYTMKDMRRGKYGGRINLRSSLILEELIEFMRSESLVDQVDALTDMMYLVIGTAVELGVDLQPCLEIVHSKNMEKLDPVTGKPIIDAAGKVRKPPDWTGPEMKLLAEIGRQRRS